MTYKAPSTISEPIISLAKSVAERVDWDVARRCFGDSITYDLSHKTEDLRFSVSGRLDVLSPGKTQAFAPAWKVNLDWATTQEKDYLLLAFLEMQQKMLDAVQAARQHELTAQREKFMVLVKE